MPSNDWTTKLNELKRQVKRDQIRKATTLLDPNPNPLDKYNKFVLSYAEILNRWGLFDKRVEILKYITNKQILDNSKQECEGLTFRTVCSACSLVCEQSICKVCKSRFRCSICNIPTKGLSMFCFTCGHGGHPDHMSDWFKNESICAVENCRCICTFSENLEV